ncbi:MAG: hypothetical protein PHF14_07485 [Verrucomicrobiota bacterium]|jgi:hypothetical protein|nr:hypothetical protein [Verrucomicrobiota bacterium]MDD8046287.1 hypothetical protein [Verrucomicrobiota bacterium]MDD8050153.1 hypothetical protein [Verrucomicrobiota bacterium]MDI9383691.1 hypothetical protein [Verrucomicrobiota bacterium]
MAEPGSDYDRGCSGECAHCSMREPVTDAPYRGGRLAWASVVVFLLPLILGCWAAALWGETPAVGFLAGVGGFLLGAVLSFLLLQRLPTNSG